MVCLLATCLETDCHYSKIVIKKVDIQFSIDVLSIKFAVKLIELKILILEML